MSRVRAGLVLLLVQLALVLSIAGKYAYERHTRPRVWVRATQFDPNQPLRGRYLALQLVVDACALPRDQSHFEQSFLYDNTKRHPGKWNWETHLVAASGKLVPVLEPNPKHPEEVARVSLDEDKPCRQATVQEQTEYFIADTARTPFPLAAGTELWVEVTVPAEGPPRPIQMALSGPAGWQPLRF